MPKTPNIDTDVSDVVSTGLSLDPAKFAEALNLEDAHVAEEGLKSDALEASTNALIASLGKEPESPTGEEEVVAPTQKNVPAAKTDVKVDAKDVTSPVTKAAIEAHAALQQILDDNGYDSLDDLKEDLSSGRELKDIIGPRDAKKVVESADTLERYNRAWAEQDAKAKEESETPDETVARLKRENQELRRAKDGENERAQEIRNQERVLKEFNSTVDDIVNADNDLGEDGRILVKLLLGVDNPSGEIEPGNKKAIKDTSKAMIERVKRFVSKVQQDAINKYAKGKLKITPITKSDTDTTNVSASPRSLKGLSVEDTFAELNKQVLEMVQKL